MGQRLNRLFALGILAAAVLLALPPVLEAALLNGESIALSNPSLNQTGVTYSIFVSNQSTTTIRCITVRFTDTLGSNSLPAGMDISGASLDASSTIVPTPGAWTTTGVNATGIVSITNAAGEAPAGGSNQSIVLNGMENGSVGNTTYYAEVTTYSNVGCTTVVDNDGTALFIFTSGVLITSTVSDSLNFSLTPGCSAGALNESLARTCTLDMHASTNHATGYSVSYSAANTMHESGNLDSITAIGATAQPSTPGTKQFGFNLVANTAPVTGANPVGGSGTVVGQYGIADKFAFTTAGGLLATTAASSADTQYTVSYLVNVAPNMVSGNYVAQQTYTIVANP